MPPVMNRNLHSRPTARNLQTAFATAAVVAALVAGPALANTPDPRAAGLSSQQRFEVLLERIKFEQDKLTSLRATFEQTKSSHLLAQEQRSLGTMSFRKPDRVRWEYTSPDPMVIIVAGETMLTWFKDLGRADQMAIGRYSEQVFRFMGATAPLESLTEYFSVQARFPEDVSKPYELTLEPRYRRIAKKLAKMTIAIDPVSFVPVRLEYVEADGDTTVYVLTAIERNLTLDDKLFDLALPPEVAVRKVDLGAK
jgi:outer membrane lipoprotein carrier protein